jgi:1,5-anhydro-D-fructose reductase (1,5-anhydro-D-mannitol-forming)
MEKIGICGLGLIGRQRLVALNNLGWDAPNVLVLDPNIQKIDSSGFTRVDSIQEMIEGDVNRVIVATPHHVAPELTSLLLDHNLFVLMEKPMGRNLFEAQMLHSHPNAHKLSVGFNYRFMPSVIEAKKVVDSSVLGDIHTIRMELGHGGSPQDKNSWKLEPKSAGGGVVLDPGIHLLDLINYLFPTRATEVKFLGANSWKGFWNTGIEEAVNVVGKVSSSNLNLSVSVVSWKTRFEIEIIGTDGYLKLNGRGRSDGPQTITYGERWGWMNGKSQIDSETTRTVATSDESLALEIAAWLSFDPRVGNAEDGLSAEILRNNILEIL